MGAEVIAVACDGSHSFSKMVCPEIEIIAGQGVRGDAHAGTTVRHRSRVQVDPDQPNLRQVHLIQGELFEELAAKGFHVRPGELGENIATRGLDLLGLPKDTLLHIGLTVQLQITGLRNPCAQIDRFQNGLLSAVLEKASDGGLIRKAGIMSIARRGGVIRAGDKIEIELPAPPFRALDRV